MEILKKHIPTVISADMHSLGNLMSDGVIDLDGNHEGNIKCTCLTIRKNGRVQGDIFAEELHVYGAVHGVIKAREVHLYASCRVEGIIVHRSLTIEDGAFVEGQFKRVEKVSEEGGDANIAELEVFRQMKLIGA